MMCAATLGNFWSLQRIVMTVITVLGSLSLNQSALPAPRDLLKKIGPTVLDEAPLHYRFESFTIADEAGQPRWLVRVGIPLRKPRESGFPAFWMLDGNAALAEFDQTLLAELAAQALPQVLVYVGNNNAFYFDVPAREYDYTFVPETYVDSDGTSKTIGGGANALLTAIEKKIRPEINRRIKLDPNKQTLWGHSLGGLFTLYALYMQTSLFQTYAAASPSLWWRGGALLAEPEQDFISRIAVSPTRVLLSLSDGERASDSVNRSNSNPSIMALRRRSTPSDAAVKLAERLQAVPGLTVDYHEFSGLTHGPMFRASLMHTLHIIADLVERNKETAQESAQHR